MGVDLGFVSGEVLVSIFFEVAVTVCVASEQRQGGGPVAAQGNDGGECVGFLAGELVSDVVARGRGQLLGGALGECRR